MSTQAEIAYLNKLSLDITNSLTIITSAVGIPANLISIFIFARLLRNKTNMGFLGLVQSSVDLIMLLLYLFVFRSQLLFGTAFINQNDTSCRVITFFRRFMVHISSWVPVVIAFDRFTFVLYGHSNRFKFMKSKLVVGGIIAAIFFIIAALDIPNFLFYKIGPVCSSDYVVAISSDLISISLRTYIPFTLMILFNIFMVRKIFRNRAALKQNNTDHKKEFHFTMAVIAFDIYFLFINFPLSVFYIMNDINLYSNALKGDPVFSAKYSLAALSISTYANCVQAFSIVMHLAFNRLYRSEVKYEFRKVFFMIGLNSIHPDLSNTAQPSHSIRSLHTQ